MCPLAALLTLFLVLPQAGSPPPPADAAALIDTGLVAARAALVEARAELAFGQPHRGMLTAIAGLSGLILHRDQLGAMVHAQAVLGATAAVADANTSRALRMLLLAAKGGELPFDVDAVGALASDLPPRVADPFRAAMYLALATRALTTQDDATMAACVAALEGPAAGDGGRAAEAGLLRAELAMWRLDLAGALAAHGEALAGFAARGDLCGVAAAEYGLARVRLFMEDADGAFPRIDRAMAIVTANGLPPLVQFGWTLRAKALFGVRRFAEAVEAAARGVQLAEGLADPRVLLDALILRAQLLCGVGDLDTALAVFRRCRAIAQAAGDGVGEGEALRNVAMVQFGQDQLVAAAASLEEAMAIAVGCGDRHGEVECRYRLAVLADRMGDVEAVHRHALAGSKVLADESTNPYLGLLLLLIAEAEMRLGDHAAALEHCDRAFELARNEADDLSCGNAMLLRSYIFAQTQDGDLAFESAREAVRLGQSAGDLDLELRGRLMCATARTDSPTDAARREELDAILERAAEFPEVRAYGAVLRGALRLRLGDLTGAAADADLAHSLATEHQLGDALRQAALLSSSVCLEQDVQAGAGFARAEAAAAQALALAERDGVEPMALRATERLLRCAVLRGDVEAAEQRLAAASELLERIAGLDTSSRLGVEAASRLRAMYASIGASVQTLTELRIARAADAETRAAEIDRGFTRSSAYQARALLEGLVEHRAGARSARSVALRKRRDELLALRDIALRRGADALRLGDAVLAQRAQQDAAAQLAEAQAVGAEIAREFPREAALWAPPPVSIDALRGAGLLAGSAALLAFVESDARLLAFVVDARGADLVALGELDQVSAELGAFMRDVADVEHLGDVGDVARHGGALYRRLLAPLLARLAQAPERLIVVPSDLVAALPFEALVTGAPVTPVAFADLDFVLDGFEVTYAPSVPVLLELASTPPRARGEVRVIADPQLSAGSTLPPLVHAAAEAEIVARRCGEPLRAFRGQEATVEALRGDLRPVSVLHFAAHGVMSDRSPNDTGIVLRGDDANPRLFSVADVLDLDLDADLVVLSACSTSLGHHRALEGIESLARAFLFAGGRSVIASVWPLSDAAAPALIGEFYRGYITDGRAPAMALLLAKRAVRRGTDPSPGGEAPLRGVRAVGGSPRTTPIGHPFLWAPLIHVGAPDRD